MSLLKNYSPHSRWVVLDLDGTIGDHRHRINWLQAKDYEAFHSRLMDDKPYLDIIRLLEIFDIHNMEGNPICTLAITGRDEKWRELTRQWMEREDIQIDEILMRPSLDYRSDPELKIALMEEFFGSKEETLKRVVFALEDRDTVVEAYRNYGLACWQVRMGTH